MHGRIDSFDLLCFMFRHEIYTPDILIIFVTFDKDRVQILINILLKFLIIFLLNSSETEVDKLEFQD